jgi:hypothetical protein
MALFAQVFPFGDGKRVPVLDQDAVVGSSAGINAGRGQQP